FGPEHPDVRIRDLLNAETLQARERLRHHERRHDQAEAVAGCEKNRPAECRLGEQREIEQRMLADEKNQDGDRDEYRCNKPRPCNNWVFKPKESVALLEEQDQSSKSDREEDVAWPVDVPNPHGLRSSANEPPGKTDKHDRPGQVEIIEPRPT